MCRTWAGILALLILSQPVRGQGGDTVPNPAQHVSLAHHWLTTATPEADRPYTRFVSLWAVSDAEASAWRKLLFWWIHQLTFEPAVALPRQVPGSAGRLYAIDLRDYRWSYAAWNAVAVRDPYTREPWVPFPLAQQLRQGAHTGMPKIAKDGTRSVLALVRGDWLIRETLETARSPSYYDLLFSRQRFGESAYWPGGVDRGAHYDAGWYHDGATPKGLVNRDFPRDEADWNRAFGIDLVKTFAEDTEVDLDFGAVVAGGRDHPGTGSIVALNNRLVVTLQGPYGAAMKTFDATETAGAKDYSETLIFAGGKFRKGRGARAINDGGELLAYLPNGGQAGFLVDGRGKRVEVAAATVANDTADKVLNQGVRNPGSCVTCHASAGGFIMPRDLYQEGLDAGIDRKFKDREQRNRVKAFFLGWEKRVAAYQQPYEDLVERTTQAIGDKGPVKPWTGVEVGQAVLTLRRGYDAPVDVRAAARELGVPEGAFRYLCSRSPHQRPLELLQGRTVPRVTWERDTYREMGLLLDAYREHEDYKRLSEVR